MPHIPRPQLFQILKISEPTFPGHLYMRKRVGYGPAKQSLVMEHVLQNLFCSKRDTARRTLFLSQSKSGLIHFFYFALPALADLAATVLCFLGGFLPLAGGC